MSEKRRGAVSLIALTIGLFVVSFLLARYPTVAPEGVAPTTVTPASN